MAKKKARVLADLYIDGLHIKPNQVIEAPAAYIKSLGSDVDTKQDAVKYCLDELGAEVIALDIPDQSGESSDDEQEDSNDDDQEDSNAGDE